MSDNAAQKKVSRALTKLHDFLTKRGVKSTAGALTAFLSAHSVVAAPATLAQGLSIQSLAGAATTGGSLRDALISLSTSARIQVGAGLLALTTITGFVSHQLTASPPDPLTTSTTQGASSEPVAVAPPAALKPDPPNPEQTVASLVAAAAAEWAGGRESITAMAKALGFLTQLRPEQIREALSLVGELSDAPARALLTHYLLSHWAESDAPAAMAWASQEAPEAHQADMIQGVLNAWAGRDPEAVMGWKDKRSTLQPLSVSESVIATVFRTIAKQDPSKALSRLELLASPNERGQALRGILDTVQTDAARKHLSSMIAHIERDDIRVQARRAVVEQWARRAPAAAAAFVEKAEPAWERTRLMDSLGLTWLQSDPARAAEWWVAKAPGPDTLVKIINVWAQQDPNEAGRWLGEQASGPTSDAARMTFARQVADLDPESALRWAETISDTPLRESTMNDILTSWSLRDAEAAAAFQDSSN